MKLWTALAKIHNLLGYMQRRKKKRLYKQWIERADLPPEAMPKEEFAEEQISEVDKKQLYRRLLYILLGVFLVVLCVGLILLTMHSC